MKKLIILIAVFTLSSGVFAQEKMNKNMEHKMDTTDHTKDHIMMKDGKMMMIKNEKTMVMDKDVTLSNGTTVMRDGTVKMKDGMISKMKNGDMIYMNGKMGKMKMDKPIPDNHIH